MNGERPALPGVRWTRDGAYFNVFSQRAERLQLCLFDHNNQETLQLEMLPDDDGLWSVYVPSCAAGQRYGFRAHGAYDPARGLRFNPAKLLIDPYARALDGAFSWSPAVFDYLQGQPDWQINPQDSAPFVPRSVALKPGGRHASPSPGVSWSDLVIYEANVRGFTMRHPEITQQDRGRFRGMANGNIVSYLKSLGITAIELMPVQSFIDEQFLVQQGLRNFWGYNTINFFTPEARYAGDDGISEFRDMVRCFHEAGIEVILDVVFNHTAEGDAHGPSLSFRGLDHLSYYRVDSGNLSRCINDTGTGNTINTDHPRVRQLIVEALCYWRQDMGVDGFRFDLATVLGRCDSGFDRNHPLLEQISSDPRLAGVRLVAEPWDPGPGGYRLGQFPAGWSEWNDRSRDSLRSFWRGDAGRCGELAAGMSGSSDLFASRGPHASINFVTAHDGFTLLDLVSYRQRHNLANGEHNRDGHSENISCNHGVEGKTDDTAIHAVRRRHRQNLLASLLLSRGVPMLLAGDEFGNSQAGNNNAYAQDNETGWLDWSGLENDLAFMTEVSDLIALRKHLAAITGSALTGRYSGLRWRQANGETVDDHDWRHIQSMYMMLEDTTNTVRAIVVLNGADHDVAFRLPGETTGAAWKIAFSTGDSAVHDGGCRYMAPAWSIACLLHQED